MKSTPIARKARKTARGAARNSRPIIMVVGSSAETRYMLRVVLEIWGYEVLEAETCDESIKLGSERRPSLILIDTTLQFLEELEYIRMFKHFDGLNAVPSVLMSGFPQATYRDAALSSGASAFLVKPIDFDLLQECVETFVGVNRAASGVGTAT